VTTRGYG
jgi:hypothetical protein